MKKTSQKFMFVALVAVLASLCLTACQKSDEPSSDTGAATNSETPKQPEHPEHPQ